MSKPDLQAEIAYWQDLLRLKDWRVTAEYVPDLCDKQGRPVHGLCSYLEDSKDARIFVRDPSTPIPDDHLTPEERVALVCAHEVYHLHFALFGLRAPAEITLEENVVWATSEALLKLRGTPRAEVLARAMRAQVAAVVAARRGAAMPQRSRRMGIDPTILAALKAALTAEDPKTAIEALLSELEAAPASEPASEPMGMDPAPGEPDKEPMGMSDPKYQRPAVQQPARYQRTLVDEGQVVRAARAAAEEVGDKLRRDLAVDRAAAAGLLDGEEARYARTLSLKDAEGMIELKAKKGSSAAGGGASGERAARNSTPSRGAPQGFVHPVLELVDRHMGVAEERPQVTVDRNGNLAISHLPSGKRRA